MTEFVLVEHPADHVRLLRLNRPEALNALTMALRAELADQVDLAGADPAVRAIIIAGSDRAFAAGADLTELVAADAVTMIQRATHRLWGRIAGCPKPVIAAVRGFALGGGCELALHADIIIAATTAVFGQPEVRVGIMPGAGGTQRLLRAVGKAQAMRLLLTGMRIPAEEALRIGLISEVTQPDATEARAIELASEIAALPSIAVAKIKETVLAGADAALETALALERANFQLLFATEDRREGMQAFLDKRPPHFEGR
ncbi:MAG: enoyl-CoA hydratase [Alphaproteobacteria bacterium]|nr:MAG: enoyl-CoA hydratase [Alphaproteobacteria bacterium]